MNFELCTDSVEGAIKASYHNFKSIELCSALSVGGLTPGFGLIQACCEQSKVEVHVMIRHKEGGFVCDQADVDLMILDIQAAMPNAPSMRGALAASIKETNNI